MIVYHHFNGDLDVPKRAVADDGKTLGDGMERIGPGHPDWDGWQNAIKRGVVEVQEWQESVPT